VICRNHQKGRKDSRKNIISNHEWERKRSRKILEKKRERNAFFQKGEAFILGGKARPSFSTPNVLKGGRQSVLPIPVW